jgi:hypothetical protein
VARNAWKISSSTSAEMFSVRVSSARLSALCAGLSALNSHRVLLDRDVHGAAVVLPEERLDALEQLAEERLRVQD